MRGFFVPAYIHNAKQNTRAILLYVAEVLRYVEIQRVTLLFPITTQRAPSRGFLFYIRVHSYLQEIRQSLRFDL